MDSEKNSRRKNIWLGILWTVLSVLGWASSYPCGIYLAKHNQISPTSLGVFRFIFGALLLAVFIPIMRSNNNYKITKRDHLCMFGLGTCGVTLMGMFLFTAQKFVSTVNASMLDGISPLLIFILYAFKTRKIQWLQAVGVVLGMVGVMLVMGVINETGFATVISWGDTLILLGALTWAVYTILGRRFIARIGGLRFTIFTMLYGGILFVLYDWLFVPGFVVPTYPAAWGVLAFYITFPTAMAFFSWNEAQKYVPLPILSISLYFTPVVAALLGLMFLGERPTVFQFAGTILVIFAMFVEPRKVATR